MSVASGNIPEITEFFPEIEDDLSEVTWGHAINSQELLSDALKSKLHFILHKN